MVKSKKRVEVYVCQSRTETQGAIRELGDAQRELARIQTHINDAIAAITDAHKTQIDALRERIDTLTGGIQLWCEAHRAELTADGSKTASLVTGEVCWRDHPASVKLRNQERVIEALRGQGFTRFLREKTEVNKQAILAEFKGNPHVVSGIPGITIESGVEYFSVSPFEIEVPE